MQRDEWHEKKKSEDSKLKFRLRRGDYLSGGKTEGRGRPNTCLDHRTVTHHSGLAMKSEWSKTPRHKRGVGSEGKKGGGVKRSLLFSRSQHPNFKSNSGGRQQPACPKTGSWGEGGGGGGTEGGRKKGRSILLLSISDSNLTIRGSG